MTNIYDESGSVHVPVGVTDEWIQALDAEGIPKSLQKALIEKAQHRAKEADAEQKLAEAVIARENRQSSALRTLSEAEINQCVLITLDHIKGTMLAAQKLQDVIAKHTTPPDGPQKRGNINTALDYIIAHIFLLDGVKLSKKPLHDLRAVNTPEQADACGISHKNLSMLWKCLLSIQKSGDTIPLGNETQLFDRARTMTKHAEEDQKAEQEAQQTRDALKQRKKRLDAHSEARHAFFPDLAVYSDHEHLGELYRKVHGSGENDGESEVRKPLGIEQGGESVARKDGPRTADRGTGMSKMAKENMRLIKMAEKR